MRSHTRAIFVSAAVALLTIFIALGRAVADPPAAGATAPAPATPDKDIYFSPKTLDLEFFLPGEYTQVSVDEASAHGDTFEAFGPAEKDAFKPHIEMIRFDNLPKNAVVNKDLIHQMATMMGQKVKMRETMSKKGDKEVEHTFEIDMGKGFQPMGTDSCKK